MEHSNGVKRLNATVALVLKGTFVLVVVFSLFSYLFLAHPMDEIAGVVIGALVGVYAFIDLKNTLLSATFRDPRSAKIYTSIRYVLRYIVVALVFMLVIKNEHVGIFGAILGFLSVKISIYGTHLVGDKEYFAKIFRRDVDGQ